MLYAHSLPVIFLCIPVNLSDIIPGEAVLIKVNG